MASANPAWTDANVVSAREAFCNCKAFVSGWSNYEDVKLVASLKNAKSLAQVNELERTYIAYMQALEPFQPKRSEVDEQKEKLMESINDEAGSLMNLYMKGLIDSMPDAKYVPMMYVVPQSGTYWVKGVPFAREQAGRARTNMYFNGATVVVFVAVVAAFIYKKCCQIKYEMNW